MRFSNPACVGCFPAALRLAESGGSHSLRNCTAAVLALSSTKMSGQSWSLEVCVKARDCGVHFRFKGIVELVNLCAESLVFGQFILYGR